jgi:hypothetical protein
VDNLVGNRPRQTCKSRRIRGSLEMPIIWAYKLSH